MSFYNIMIEFQDKEENKNKIVLARCGVFMVAIGKDAIFLNKALKLNVTCIKNGICKIGIPVTYTLKYANLLEEMGFGYTIYDYSVKDKEFTKIYSFDGISHPEIEKNIGCESCKYYKKHNAIDNIYIFDILKKREEERKRKLEEERWKK